MSVPAYVFDVWAPVLDWGYSWSVSAGPVDRNLLLTMAPMVQRCSSGRGLLRQSLDGGAVPQQNYLGRVLPQVRTAPVDTMA